MNIFEPFDGANHQRELSGELIETHFMPASGEYFGLRLDLGQPKVDDEIKKILGGELLGDKRDAAAKKLINNMPRSPLIGYIVEVRNDGGSIVVAVSPITQEGRLLSPTGWSQDLLYCPIVRDDGVSQLQRYRTCGIYFGGLNNAVIHALTRRQYPAAAG